MTTLSHQLLQRSSLKYFLCFSLFFVGWVVSSFAAGQAALKSQVSAEQDWSQLFKHETTDLSSSAVQSIQNRLQLSELIHSGFEQNRNIRVLKRPLVSSGHFYYKKNAGVCWLLQKPYSATLVIGEKTIMEKNSAGQFVELAGANNAQFNIFSKLFFSVFNGQFSQLEDVFKLYVSTVTQQGWTVGLEPKQSLLKKAIHRVIVQGNDAIQSVTLIDPAGDITRIKFDFPSHTPDSSHEDNCFAGS